MHIDKGARHIEQGMIVKHSDHGIGIVLKKHDYLVNYVLINVNGQIISVFTGNLEIICK